VKTAPLKQQDIVTMLPNHVFVSTRQTRNGAEHGEPREVWDTRIIGQGWHVETGKTFRVPKLAHTHHARIVAALQEGTTPGLLGIWVDDPDEPTDRTAATPAEPSPAELSDAERLLLTYRNHGDWSQFTQEDAGILLAELSRLRDVERSLALR
jgi:hypothetical protein